MNRISNAVAPGLIRIVFAAVLAASHCAAQTPLGVSGAAGSTGTHDSVNWKGPDVIAYGAYDRLPVHQATEFSELLSSGQSFAGRVRPRAVTLAQALALGRQALAKNRVVLPAKAVGKSPQGRDLFSLQAQAVGELLRRRTVWALGYEILAYEAAPREPAVLLNLAAVFAAMGLPNEAIAVLDEVDRIGTLAASGTFVSPRAVAAYLRGYSELLRGNYSKAKEQLIRARQLDPFLRESALALAVAEARLGEEAEARKTYASALWRRMPARIVILDTPEGGKRGPAQTAAPGSPEAVAAEEVTAPMDEMFDLSAGKDGKLPLYSYPHDITDVYAWHTKRRPELNAFGLATMKKGQQVSALRGPLPGRTTRYGAWADRYQTLIGMTRYWDPVLAPLFHDRQQAENEFTAENKRVVRIANERYKDASRETNGRIPCSTLLAIGNEALHSLIGPGRKLEAAERRYYPVWYRLTTGMVAQVGNPGWHTFLAAEQQWDADIEWQNLWGRLDGTFENAVQIGTDRCMNPAPAPPLEPRPMELVERCPDHLRGKAFEFEFEMPFSEGPTPKLSLAMNCDSVSVGFGVDVVHVDAGLVEFGAGPYGEVEVEREGDVTIFVGGSGSATIGPGSAGVKAGGYVKVNSEGIKDAGIKATSEAKVSAHIGETSAGVKTKSDLFNVSIAPSVPEPQRGPMLQEFGKAPGRE